MPLSALRDRITRVAEPRAVGVARAAVGVAAILEGLERAPILERMTEPGTLSVPYVAGQPTILVVPAAVIVIAWVVLAATFAAGAFTTQTGISLVLLLAAVLFSDQQLYSNHLYLLIWFVGLLTLARSGSALSVDAWRGRGRASVAAWPIDLLRLQVIVLYLFAGISKLNLVYLSGTVVAVSLRQDGPLAVPAAWRSFEVMAAASFVSVLAELGLAVGLALPRWRRAAFVVGLGVHATIALWFDPTLPLVIFGLMSLGPYVLFLHDRPGRLSVVWDDSCTFCSAWVSWVRRLDWLRVIRLVPSSDARERERLGVSLSEADEALQLVGPHQRSSGFRAVVGILEALPLSFLWAPLLRFWPIQRLGAATYRRVAQRRKCGLKPRASRSSG